MADERSEDTNLDTMNVTLSESELEEFALSAPPESTDQPAGDKKSDEDGTKGPENQDKEKDGEKDKDSDPAPGKEGEKDGEKDQDKDKDKEGSDSKTEPEEEEEEDPTLLEFEDKKYTQSELKTLIKGGMLESDYRQKTQELGVQRAAIEPFIKFLETVKGDPKGLIKDFRDALVEENGEEAGKLLDESINFDPETFSHPDAQKAKDLQVKVDQFEAKEAFENAQKTFISDMKTKGIKVSRKEAAEVGQFTLDYFEKNKAALNLEDAYKLMKADGWRTTAAEVTEEAKKKAAEEAEKKKGHDAIPSKEKGASDFSKVQDQATPSSGMKVSMEEAKEVGITTFFDP